MFSTNGPSSAAGRGRVGVVAIAGAVALAIIHLRKRMRIIWLVSRRNGQMASVNRGEGGQDQADPECWRRWEAGKVREIQALKKKEFRELAELEASNYAKSSITWLRYEHRVCLLPLVSSGAPSTPIATILLYRLHRGA